MKNKNNKETEKSNDNQINKDYKKECNDSKSTKFNISLNNEELTPAQLAEMAINALFKDAQHDCVDVITPSKKITLEKDSYEGVSTNVDYSNLLVFKFEDKTTVIISQEFIVEGYDLKSKNTYFRDKNKESIKK